MSNTFVTELFVNNDWVDVSNKVRDAQGVTIARGRPNEATSSNPASMACVLDNTSGNFSPRNPTGLYYGSFGRNTPIRGALQISRDTFARTVSSGWGTDDTGDAYSAFFTGSAAASDFNVAGGFGTHRLGAANQFLASTLEGLQYGDLEIAATVSVPFTVTGGTVEACNLLLRVPAAHAVYYRVRVAILTNATLRISVLDSTTITLSASITPPFSHIAAQPLRVRAHIDGPFIRAKVWQPGITGEPLGWNVTLDINSITGSVPALTAFGGVGIYSSAVTGNTNVPFTLSYSNVVVRNLRFTGEVSDAQVTWDPSESDVITTVTAGSALRRLGQGTQPRYSPSRRFISRLPGGNGVPTGGLLDVVAWWPLEDASNIIDGQAEVAVGATAGPLISTRTTANSTVAYGDTTGLPPGAPATLRLANGGGFRATFSNSVITLANAWTCDFTAKIDIGKDGVLYWLGPGATIGDVNSFYVKLLFTQTGSVQLVYSNPTFGETTVFSAVVEDDTTAPDDGVVAGWAAQRWHHYSVSTSYTAGNLKLALLVDGNFINSLTTPGATAPPWPTRIEVHTDLGTAGPLNIGHVVMRAGTTEGAGPTAVEKTFSSTNLGGVGETAGARILRIAGEENIPITPFGVVATTPQMGAQALDTPLALMLAGEAVDLGIFYEPRSDNALVYRTRKSLYNQTPVLVADYAAGQIDPPFVPVDDDQRTRNSILVTRIPNGAVTVTATLTTGRMSSLPAISGGIGPYLDQRSVNVATDGQLASIAGFALNLGTVDETRYPCIAFERARPQLAALSAALLSVEIGDRLQVAHPKASQSPSLIDQICDGYTERIDSLFHSMVFVCAPASPYNVLNVNTSGSMKIDASNSVLTGGPYAPAVTSLSVAPAAGTSDQWQTSGPFGFDILVGGEQMTVTNITGSGTQTFTVTRSVNGVSKTQATGTPVALAKPFRIAY